MNPESAARRDLVEVGRVFKPRGVRGEVFVSPDLEGHHPFAEGSTAWLDTAAGPSPMAVERFFVHKGRCILKLSGLNSYEDAAEVQGRAILLSREDAGELPDGCFGVEEALGAAVVDASRGGVGTVKEVRPGPAYWSFVVSGPRGPFEVPAVAGLGVEVREGAGEVRCDLPRPWPGLDEAADDPRGAAGEERDDGAR